jgi:protein-tyrosine-phosphatase
MESRIYNVLFLCTGNSARSIMAEALLNHWGKRRFRAFSAGSHPKGKITPLALEVLRQRGLPTEGLHSKSWEEFSRPRAPTMDFIITVCDNAAGEACPVWPGHPLTAHWGIEDPVAVEGTEEQRLRAFQTACRELENRIKIFTSPRFDELDKLRLKRRLDEIDRSAGE